MPKVEPWRITLNGEYLDTVFFVVGHTADDIKLCLVTLA